MRLFRKKDTPAQTDVVFEKWHTAFSFFRDHRFEPESSGDYCSRIENGKLTLEINKRNLFAWTDDPLYRYDNFLLKAELGMDPSNAYSSAGFLFRRTEDLSYYYLLISNKGYYRLDLVLNGTPSCLIDWTPCAGFSAEKFNLVISADGGRISLYLNSVWIGHVFDDALAAGGFSFAGQNYDEQENALFHLYRFEVESRPAKLETRREKLLPQAVDAAARMRFAESRLRSGHYQAALIEVRQALGQKPDDAGLLLMGADCCINLGMYAEASGFLERTPEHERDQRWYLQKAGMLYMKNDFLELRNFLRDSLGAVAENPAACNLLGNAEYALGNWEESVAAYKSAVELDTGQPLFAFNAARALQKCGLNGDAAAMYGDAARLYFRQERYDELEGILPFLDKIDDNPETDILRAKLLFHNGEYDEAGDIFNRLIDGETTDSAVFYLYALIKTTLREDASVLFSRAAELEPGYYLYHFKFAEYLFLNGEDCTEPLAKAVELASDDPWVLNLAGQVSAASGDFGAAVESYGKALESAPEESVIRVNYSEALFLMGSPDDALSLLGGDDPALVNQRGNILSRMKSYGEAVREYEAALDADRGNVDIMMNLAAACIESDSYVRAEELLVKVLDSSENAHAYNMMGNLAALKGEYGRAEAAFTKALEVDPEYVDAVCNLAELLISRERLHDADMLLQRSEPEDPGERFMRIKAAVFNARMNRFDCSSCEADWVVPKKIPEQPALKLIGEPPDSMPAGKCSSCGAVYCIGCAKEHLEGGRLVCAECGAPLKLSEDWMRYIYHKEGF